jgi:surface protein
MLLLIKNKYILKKVFENLDSARYLEIIRHNKTLQNTLGLTIKDYESCYKEYNKIEIEVKTTVEKKYDENLKFINIPEEDKSYYHIYYYGPNDEIIEDYHKDEISKIKIIIDVEVKSLKGLFQSCYDLEEVNFIKCNRKDITDMSSMLFMCFNLVKVNMANLKTPNVTDMNCLFGNCLSLNQVNLSNLNTSKVTNMAHMFYNCHNLEELDLSSFNTSNVTKMDFMFYNCSSLKKLNLSNFDTSKVASI